MNSTVLDPDELIVKADYFLSIKPKEEHLKRIKNEIAVIMKMEGYQQVDPDPNFFGPTYRTTTFLYEFDEPKKTTFSDFKKKLGLLSEADIHKRHREAVFKQLEERRDDLPFKFEFQFRTMEQAEHEGYEVSIIAIPTLLQKHRQQLLPPDHTPNVKDTVTSTKSEVQRVMGKIEGYPLRQPYTEAETLDNALSNALRENLRQTEYGRKAIQYIDEGDTAFQRKLLNAALSCYIHAIEWTIITYLKQQADTDVIEEQQSGGSYHTYYALVDRLEDETPASQKTVSKLSNLNQAERRWMAHHKSGETVETDVLNVRDRLLVLIEELFTGKNTYGF